MNNVILCGRICRDIDLKTSQSGMAIAKFAIAVDRKYKRDGEPTADFINCVAFDKKATFISTYFGKGRRILITGRIQTGSYTDKDGNKRTSFDVIVEDAEFCDSKSDNNTSATPAPAPAQTTSQPSNDGFTDVAPDELPFF